MNQLPLCLAPMVGLSHAVLRQVIQDYMPHNTQTLWPTEMLNSRKLPQENLGQTAETLISSSDKALVPQILGNDQAAIEQSIFKMQHNWFSFNKNSFDPDLLSGVDINMGCPVQKALKHNYGVALMGDLNYAASVVSFAKKAVEKCGGTKSIPVSVKLRAVGSEKSLPELIHFVQTLIDAGADSITLHPRTAAQKRKGNADWLQITELKKAVKCPIIGNGDVQTYQDALNMLETTGCDLAMSGRGLAARPWMVWQLGYHLGFDNNLSLDPKAQPPLDEESEGAEYGIMLVKFIKLSEQYFCKQLNHSPEYALRKINFFVRTTHVWLEFGHTLMSEMTKSKSITEMIERTEKFFNQPQRMVESTNLRQ